MVGRVQLDLVGSALGMKESVLHQQELQAYCAHFSLVLLQVYLEVRVVCPLRRRVEPRVVPIWYSCGSLLPKLPWSQGSRKPPNTLIELPDQLPLLLGIHPEGAEMYLVGSLLCSLSTSYVSVPSNSTLGLPSEAPCTLKRVELTFTIICNNT